MHFLAPHILPTHVHPLSHFEVALLVRVGAQADARVVSRTSDHAKQHSLLVSSSCTDSPRHADVHTELGTLLLNYTHNKQCLLMAFFGGLPLLQGDSLEQIHNRSVNVHRNDAVTQNGMEL